MINESLKFASEILGSPLEDLHVIYESRGTRSNDGFQEMDQVFSEIHTGREVDIHSYQDVLIAVCNGRIIKKGRRK